MCIFRWFLDEIVGKARDLQSGQFEIKRKEYKGIRGTNKGYKMSSRRRKEGVSTVKKGFKGKEKK